MKINFFKHVFVFSLLCGTYALAEPASCERLCQATWGIVKTIEAMEPHSTDGDKKDPVEFLSDVYNALLPSLTSLEEMTDLETLPDLSGVVDGALPKAVSQVLKVLEPIRSFNAAPTLEEKVDKLFGPWEFHKDFFEGLETLHARTCPGV